jgi:hypothetical protein
MNSQTNTVLLKEYIKTLIAAEVEFPGILPRSWGNEFSRSELEAIRFTLSFVLKTATPQADPSLLGICKSANMSDTNMHWVLCNFWPQIVPLLTQTTIN